MPQEMSTAKKWIHHSAWLFWLLFGSFLAALSIRIFLIPNHLIDGGVVGIALIISRLWGDYLLSWMLLLLNLPFVYLAITLIRKTFVLHMSIAVIAFSIFLAVLRDVPPFFGDVLEVIVFGGALLGIGAGLIIRNGGCVDGTEILAIIINRKKGITIGQVILVINVFIFGAYGWIFQDWHVALRSLMIYLVAFKMMDFVISGLDELKSVLIISSKPKELGELIVHQLGLGLTILQGKGGFSGDLRDILFVIVERLDLSELKEIILHEDPNAFMAVEDLHEVVYGKRTYAPYKKRRRRLKLSTGK